MHWLKIFWQWLVRWLRGSPAPVQQQPSPIRDAASAKPKRVDTRPKAVAEKPASSAKGAPATAEPRKKADDVVAKNGRTVKPKESTPAPRAPQEKAAPKPVEKPWKPEDYQVPEEEGKTRFTDFQLGKDLLHAIADLQFQYCTPIQAETLPQTLAGNDLIGQAQTGTGKTAAFLITAIQRMLEKPISEEQRFASEPRVLALAPTRELALQIGRDAEGLCKYTGHRVVTVVGGMNYDTQREQLRHHVVDILVATPGRLIDFLGSQDVFLDQLDLLIIDEADRMLDMGFIPDVKRIIRKCTPREERQTLLFSATFNQDVLNLASMWTRSAAFVEIEPEQKTAERVEQTVYMVSEDDKLKVLCNYLLQHPVDKAIVFANRRDQTRDLEEALRRQGVRSALLSGEIAQNKRLRTLEQFKAGDIQVLVATDVAGRGIHVDGVSHVFNYNLPENAEDYVHRIGRTGRAGESGVSVSFASEDDAFALPAIEAYIGQKLNCVIPEESLLAQLAIAEQRRSSSRSRPRQGGRQGGGGKGRRRA